MVLVWNRPNPNLDGKRQTEIYGHETPVHVAADRRRAGGELPIEIEFPRNAPWIHAARNAAAGIVVVPAAFGAPRSDATP
jgi:3-dehydroquinate dehydratase